MHCSAGRLVFGLGVRSVAGRWNERRRVPRARCAKVGQDSEAPSKFRDKKDFFSKCDVPVSKTGVNEHNPLDSQSCLWDGYE